MPYSTERVIALDGVLNFRDMGGYPTQDGRKVRNGLFFRSASLTKMTEEDRRKVQSLGIRTIFDYRDEHEATNNPDPAIEGVQNIRVPAKGSAPFKMPSVSQKEQTNLDFYKQVDADTFAQFYAQMPFNNPSFQALMKLIQEKTNLGLLHHCAAGKDRTGVGGALILMALDVPKETIMQDYLVTNNLLTTMVEKLAHTVSKNYSNLELTHFYDIMSAKEQYLNAVFREIERRYESTEQFLEHEFAISRDMRKQLQNEYLL
ncbi:tyrosine-protein phosphatase [Solibacillus sp. FSL H8-0538]|uniref:tyrosine-protein phosphatase n=1 Tax=Solibacillus sp. FSL H8-0538 TaxID=2921400 RepID=UPI0030F7998F